MAVVETLVARLEADTAQFQSGMGQATQTIKGLDTGLARVTTTTETSHRAINTLKSGMVGLAMQATGTSGPVGKLAQGLLLFGGGSTLILGVAAGIGAISLAYQALTKDSRESEQATKDMEKALGSLGAHAQLTAARIGLGRARARLGEVDSDPQGFANRIIDVFRSEGERETRRQAALRDVAAAENAVAAATQEAAKWQQGIADNAYQTWRAEQAHVEALKDGLGVMLRIKATAESPGFTKATSADGVFKELGGKDIAFKGGASELQEALRRLGESAGKQFALGMITGIQSMQDFMRSILVQFLSLGLDAVFGDLFGSFFSGGKSGGGKAGIEGSLKPSAAVVSPASFNLQTSGAMSPPTTIFALQRDAEWQRVLRGSIIEARKDGFR